MQGTIVGQLQKVKHMNSVNPRKREKKNINVWNNNEPEFSPKLMSEIRPHFQDTQESASRVDARKMAPGPIFKPRKIQDRKPKYLQKSEETLGDTFCTICLRCFCKSKISLK